MADPTDLVGFTPDLEGSGVWFGALNCVARREWLPLAPLVWGFLPDPRALPVRGRARPGAWLFGCSALMRETTVPPQRSESTEVVDLTTEVVDLTAEVVDLTTEVVDIS